MKSKKIAYLLWFFLGWFGIHRFYCRKWFTGALWLLTLGLFGLGWGADAMLTWFLVDKANGVPERIITNRLQIELRIFLIFFAGPILGLLIVLSTTSWLSEKLDRRTPAQKARDSHEAWLRKYTDIQKDFPAMKVDGKVVRVDIQWLEDEMVLVTPKTYGLVATRFAQESVRVPRDTFLNSAQGRASHYFINVSVKVWRGPTHCPIGFLVAIPKSMVPISFQRQTTVVNGRMATHSDSTYGYALSYPSSWQPPTEALRRALHEQAVDRDVLLIAVSPDGQLYLQVWLFNELPKEGDTLDTLLEKMFKNSPFSKEDAKTDVVETAGEKAIQCVVDTTTPVGQAARYLYVILIHEGRVWTFGIGGNRDRFQENKNTIYDIVKSIRFGTHE